MVSRDEILKKQHYRLVGKHSSVKTCHWMRQSLLYNRVCYKEEFYGIKTHRCLQMTPATDYCTQNCLFCWRFQGFNQTEMRAESADEPELILDEAIKEQRLLISGFKGDERCDMKKWKEAQNPTQVAVSLSGEPTLYPKLDSFFALCKRKGMTTFLVTNGTTPKILENLNTLPTQLYITVAAPNKEIYKKLCRPVIDGAWERLQETIELLPSLDTRTVIRHTLVQGENLGFEKEYAKMDESGAPDFVEPKAYMFVGFSRKRMNLSNMPRHEKIKEFSDRLNEYLGYEFLGERSDSRVVALTKSKNIERLG